VHVTLGGPVPPSATLAVLHAAAVPVSRARVSVGGLRHVFGEVLPRPVQLVTGLRSACWVAPPGAEPPDLGRLVHRASSRIDGRGRVTLDRHVRAYLGVGDALDFEVVFASPPTGGVLIVPLEGVEERLARVTLR
jgi:hypothetical protein